MFRPIDWSNWPSYEPGWPLSDTLNPEVDKRQIFPISVLGFQTHRDDFAVAFDHADMVSRVNDMLDPSLSDQSLREKYKLKDNRDWQLDNARGALRALTTPHALVTTCSYRPFDNRECFFGHEFMDYPRRELIDHVQGKDNTVLLASRQVSDQWRHVLVAGTPANDCVVSDESSEANYAFPCYLLSDAGRRENLSDAFRSFIDTRYSNHFSPEEIFGYIYAILHSPTYRARYAEYLRIDFPRIQLARSIAQFETLSALGWQLTEAHLLNVCHAATWRSFMAKEIKELRRSSTRR